MAGFNESDIADYARSCNRKYIESNFLKVCKFIPITYVSTSQDFNCKFLVMICQVRIYFGTLDVTKTTEKPRWTAEDILLGLGGTLSLFLGISFVAALEFIELFIRLAAAILKC